MEGIKLIKGVNYKMTCLFCSTKLSKDNRIVMCLVCKKEVKQMMTSAVPRLKWGGSSWTKKELDVWWEEHRNCYFSPHAYPLRTLGSEHGK